jgi:pimeloyl-ACP methyl ester carboxylesterase
VASITLPAVGCRLAALRADPAPDAARGEAVLLVPGFTGSKEDFIALLEPLAEAGFVAVAIDQRGQFESPVAATYDVTAPESYDLATLGADLRAALAWLASTTDGPVHLLGHSFGGLAARGALLGHRDGDGTPWPASLTLLCSGPAALDGTSATRADLLASAIEGGMSLADVLAAIEAGGELGGLPEDIAAFLRRRWLANQPTALAVTGRQLLAEPDRCDDLARAARERPLPILVACGVDDDVWPPATQRSMAERLSATFTAIDGAGHSPAVDQPELTAKLLADFFARDASPGARRTG